MFINKLTGRSKKASPNPASQPASTATSPSFTNQHFQISGKPTEDSPHQRLVSPFETYPPPTKPSSSADQGYYSSLGVRHHQSSSLLDRQYQDQTVDQDGKLTGSPPSSSSSGSLPQLVRTSNHPPPIDAGKNDRSSRRSSLKSRSRKNSASSSRSKKLASSGTPAPRSHRQQALPKDYVEQQERFQKLSKSASQGLLSNTSTNQQPARSSVLWSSSSSLSSSTDSIDPTVSYASLSTRTPTHQAYHQRSHSSAKQQQPDHWPDSQTLTPTLTATPTPANQLGRIPTSHPSEDFQPSSDKSSRVFNPTAEMHQPNSSHLTSDSHSSTGVLATHSDAIPPADQVPHRPRATSYNTSPLSTRAPLPPPPVPVKRPTSLSSVDRPPQTPSVAALHSSLDSTSSRSAKKPPRRKTKGESRHPTATPSSIGIAGALALSGVSLAPHSAPFDLPGNMQSSSSSFYAHTSARSPDEKDDRSVHTTDSRAYNASSLDDQLGTGYAVASRKRNVDFHGIFKSIPEDDYLIEDYGCALQRDILVQGRLYISEQHLCFNANIFGWVTTLVIPFSDVVAIEKRMTALIIPNAIQVITTQSRHTFASFLSRDATFELMGSIWHIARPPGMVPTHGLTLDVTMPPLDDLSDGTKVGSQDSSSALSHSSPVLSKKVDHPPTQCDCSPEEHYKEVIWDATYPTSPEKLYNILFQSDFLKDFWVNEEHLTEIEVGDWTTAPDAKYPSRSVSYIRPVNAPVGPKTIKCLVSDEHRSLDFDKYVSLLSTARTPDAPAGGSFCVKTLSCITWGPNNSSRWLVTAAVEWTKVNRFLKSIIESSAISGQKAYQVGVDQALRKHIQLSQPEQIGDRAELQAAMHAPQNEDLGGSSAVSTNQPREAQNGTSLVPNKGGPRLTSRKSLTTNKILERGRQAVNINGIELSWMMIASIGLVIILLIWNLMSVRPRSSGAVEVDFRNEGRSHSSGSYNRAVKHELTRDVAETVREALQEYFRDHPILYQHGSGLPVLENIDNLPSSQDNAPSGPFSSSNPSTQEPGHVISTNEEIAQIEILLQSLEMRIRNVRRSLVENGQHNPSS